MAQFKTSFAALLPIVLALVVHADNDFMDLPFQDGWNTLPFPDTDSFGNVDKCGVQLPFKMDQETYMKNIGKYNTNILCKRPIAVRVDQKVTRYYRYGRSYTRRESLYLVGNGPSVCPWRKVASPDDCQDGEVFEEHMDQKYFKESSTSGYHIKNCKNARCRQPYSHNCPAIRKIYYYDDDGNLRSRCNSRRVLRQISRKRNKVLTAVKSGNIQQVKYWLRRGVNINNVDRDGKTALNVAVCLKNTEMVEVLLRMGKGKIKVNKVDNDGFTPLLRAVQMTLGTDIMEMLLANPKTNPNIQNKYGWTPLFLSLSNSFWSKMFLLLKDPRTNMNLVGSNGYSPLGEAYCAGAMYYTNEQIVNFVRTAGGTVCKGCHLCPSRRSLRLQRDEWVDFD